MKFLDTIHNVVEGVKLYAFWSSFGMNDIRAKYRRSKLGQWWITLSVSFFILIIGALYGSLLQADFDTYLAYLAIGYIVWLFIQSMINSGCLTLTQAKPFMTQRAWPVSVFICRLLYREVLIFLHHAVLLPPIFFWLGLWPGVTGLILGFLGFLFVIFTAFWVALLLAIISLRYRDLPPIVQSLTRMAFFATPVIWVERDLGQFAAWVVLLNPLGYFLKIIRDPLLGFGFPTEAWLVSILLSGIVFLTTLVVLSLTREKLSYWL